MKERIKVKKKIIGFTAWICLMFMMFGMTVMAENKYEDIPVKGTVQNVEQNGDVVHYYRFKINTSGLFHFSGKSTNGIYDTGLKVSLCDAKGKVLETAYVNALTDKEDTIFVLKKGTYFMKVQTANAYILASDFKSFSGKAGATLSKAVSLKRGKVKQGLFYLGQKGKKIDYYKVVLKRPAKIQLKVEGKSNDPIVVKVTPAKSVKIKRSSITEEVYNTAKRITLQTVQGGVLPKGTYYIRVYRKSGSSKANGIYALKWN